MFLIEVCIGADCMGTRGPGPWPPLKRVKAKVKAKN